MLVLVIMPVISSELYEYVRRLQQNDLEVYNTRDRSITHSLQR